MERKLNDFPYVIEFTYQAPDGDWVSDYVPAYCVPETGNALASIVHGYLMGKHGREVSAIVDHISVFASGDDRPSTAGQGAETASEDARAL